MRLGLIARADSRGLGIQTRSFHDHMRPAKTMVIDCPSAKPLPLRRDWYPDATWIKGLPTPRDFRTWLQGLDVVFTAETAYGPHLWSEADRVGVKTVLQGNFEFLNKADRPTQWVAPSMWRFDEWPKGTVYLPVPIETGRFTLNQSTDAKRFLHIVGRPAIHDRNGTEDLLEALKHVTADIEVTIRCQDRDYLASIDGFPINRRKVKLNLAGGDVENYWDNYTGQDVLIMPRRFGGLCLPANEALGAGMPVIMPHIDPNWWLPGEWLVSAHKTGSFMAKTRVDLHAVDPVVLARKIDRFATDTEFFQKAQRQALELAEGLSWEALKPEYEKVLGNA